MTENPKDWQNYPYLVEWVDSVNKWAKDFEICEFMPADDQGPKGILYFKIGSLLDPDLFEYRQ
jgi:hypothetical protein